MITTQSKKDFIYIAKYYNNIPYYLIKDSTITGTLLSNIHFIYDNTMIIGYP